MEKINNLCSFQQIFLLKCEKKNLDFIFVFVFFFGGEGGAFQHLLLLNNNTSGEQLVI
jgi:hypothetical protein